MNDIVSPFVTSGMSDVNWAIRSSGIVLSAFRSWKALEPERRKLAKKTLQGIAAAKPLSHDVFEIVGKMLE